MDTREALMTRRSIRRYKADPIPEADLKDILETGLAAPSAINLQHWYFVAVQSPEVHPGAGAALCPQPGAGGYHQQVPVHSGRCAGVCTGILPET